MLQEVHLLSESKAGSGEDEKQAPQPQTHFEPLDSGTPHFYLRSGRILQEDKLYLHPMC